MGKVHPEPRESQKDILTYERGMMGVSAVPGSGKTWTLSRLAAKLVREFELTRGQQILVVTLVNSACGKFEQQVRDFLDDNNLGTFYRVRTLHGLAKDIVSERPGLVGVADDFQVVDELETREIIHDAVTAWFNAHRDFGVEQYIRPEDRNNQQILGRWREDAMGIAVNFIKKAKDFRYRPISLKAALERNTEDLPLAAMCVNIFEAYERGLNYRGGLDFQDLICRALDALEADEQYLERLRSRWPVVLEDEAQDSSLLQEQILRRLVGDDGNWVRVGDPNQAIYETFTTANPEHLRSFLKEEKVVARELPESGRSAPGIIALANRLIKWSLDHPNESIRAKRPLAPPFISALKEGNPQDSALTVQLETGRRMTPAEERNFVAASLKEWLAANPDKTVAALLPTNATGTEMTKVLQEQKIPYTEVLRTTKTTRQVAGSLYRIVRFLDKPVESKALGDAFKAWMRDERETEQSKQLTGMLGKIANVEQFTAPRDKDWLWDTVFSAESAGLIDKLECFRGLIKRWQGAAQLPIDQLILTIAGDIFKESADIATAYSIAIHMRSFAGSSAGNRLPECVEELKEIAMNKRKFTGLGDDDEQFDPSRYPGQAVVMTLHSAKGLEWDRVHLMSVSNYDFPSAEDTDTFIGEKFYARNRLNLDAEALAQLEAVIHAVPYIEGISTRKARIEYAAERLRLFYVGITRARRELIVTWNTGKNGDMIPARPLTALARLMREGANETA